MGLKRSGGHSEERSTRVAKRRELTQPGHWSQQRCGRAGRERDSVQRPSHEKGHHRGHQQTHTHTHAVSHVRHTRALHAPARVARETARVFVGQCSNLSSTSPTTVPAGALGRPSVLRLRAALLKRKRTPPGTPADTHTLKQSLSLALFSAHSQPLSVLRSRDVRPTRCPLFRRAAQVFCEVWGHGQWWCRGCTCLCRCLRLSLLMLSQCASVVQVSGFFLLNMHTPLTSLVTRFSLFFSSPPASSSASVSDTGLRRCDAAFGLFSFCLLVASPLSSQHRPSSESRGASLAVLLQPFPCSRCSSSSLPAKQGTRSVIFFFWHGTGPPLLLVVSLSGLFLSPHPRVLHFASPCPCSILSCAGESHLCVSPLCGCVSRRCRLPCKRGGVACGCLLGLRVPSSRFSFPQASAVSLHPWFHFQQAFSVVPATKRCLVLRFLKLAPRCAIPDLVLLRLAGSSLHRFGDRLCFWAFSCLKRYDRLGSSSATRMWFPLLARSSTADCPNFAS